MLLCKHSIVGAQLCRLSIINAHTVALKPNRHYSLYCTVVFCYVHQCELSYMCPDYDINMHQHRVKLYRIGFVGSGLKLTKALT